MSRKDRDDAPKDKKPPVIATYAVAGLSAGENMLYRLLPAAVVSAGLHLILAVLAFVCTLIFTKVDTAQARAQVDVSVEDRPDQPINKNLTEETETLDPNTGALVVENAKLDDRTIETTTNEPEPAGNPSGNLDVRIDSLLMDGKPNPNAITNGSVAEGPGAGFKGGGDDGISVVNDSFKGRGSKTSRDVLLKTGGGNEKSEAAVAKGLAWLARMQKKDGTWTYDNGGDVAAATGMGLLPFLAAGQTHKSTAKDNKYKENVTAAITALLAIQKKNGTGRFSDNAYANAIAAVALCEAFGMTGDKSLLRKPCQDAINSIQDAQGPNGSWGYAAKSDGDTSIVGWQIQALHSAKMCKDLKVDPKVLEKAMKFLDGVASGSSKYKYGYGEATSERPSLTAVGLLCRYYLNGWGPNNAGMKDGAAYLLKSHPPEKEQEYDMYYYYYATQVMHFVEGDSWHKNWNPKMRDMLIEKQVSSPNKPNVDGSWDKDGAPWIGGSCGRMGTTAMAVLTLEVYYRHLPTYKRGTGGLDTLDK